MANGVLDIDHLMIATQDPDVAGVEFERLGFAVTPPSDLPGLRNRCICFPPTRPGIGNYLELLGVVDGAVAPPFMTTLLGGAEGPVSMVAATADCRAAEAELAANGFAPAPTLDLARTWRTEAGEELDVAFSVCLPAAGKAPLYWSLCRHATPQHFGRPEWTAHPNGAFRLVGVIAAADAPRGVARRFVEDWGAEALIERPEVAVVARGEVQLRVFSPQRLAEAFGPAALPRALARGAPVGRRAAALVGAVLQVRDMARTARAMAERNARFTVAEGRILVDPADACGTLLEFVA